MRIAVCLSGQSRTWRIAKDNIKKTFGDVDYFIHTWDINIYNNYKEPNMNNPIKYKISKLEEIDIINCFEPKSYEFEKYNTNITQSPWYSMYYSFMKSVWLKRKYELEHDFTYDIVIKARFDINYHQKFIYHNVYPLFCYSISEISKFTNEYNYNCLDDVLFYSDSPTMDIISNISRWIKDIQVKNYNRNGKNIDPEFHYGPGTLLYKYNVNNSIHSKTGQNIPFYVIRKEAEDLKLDGLRDVNKILKISNDFYSSVKKYLM